jgi:hypothetical protein
MTQTALGNRVESIQVAGGEVFEGSRWREAILFYLNGIWSNDVAVTHRPKINFNKTVLRRDGERYIGYYSLDPDSGDRPPVADKDVFVIPEPTRAEIENGMIRFVKNNQIRQLGICFEGKGAIVLTKGHKRSELFVCTMGNFPSVTDAMRDKGYRV